jgi:hypothetical protein
MSTKLIHRVRSLIERSERISADDCAGLFGVKNLIDLAKLARVPQERRHGRRAFYRNAHIAEYRGEHPEFFISEITTIAPADVSELILRCRWRGESLATWKERFAEFANVRIVTVALISAGFISRLAAHEGMTHEAVIAELNALLPITIGGEEGELFNPEFRADRAHGVISAEEWTSVHRTAHRLGMKTIAAMTYSTVDHPAEYASHLNTIREIQDESGGFIAFAPMAIHNQGVNEFYLAAPTAAQTLRSIATSRIFLDNISHIIAPPALVSLEVAIIGLSYGADMIDTSIAVEDVHATELPPGIIAGLPVLDESASTGSAPPSAEKVRSRIAEARWVPMQLDTMFIERAPVAV